MKRPIKFYIFSLLLIFSLGFYSCQEKEVESEPINNQTEINEALQLKAVNEAVKKNKAIVEKLYDEIALKGFDKLLNDDVRVTLKDNFSTTDLTLQKIKDSLKLQNSNPAPKGISNALSYSENLIKERDTLLGSRSILGNKSLFNVALDSIMASNRIYKAKIFDNKYENLDEEIKVLIDLAKSKYEEPQIEEIENFILTEENDEIPKEATQSSFALNLLSWILLALLLLSIGFIIFQARKIFKLKEETAKNKLVAKVKNTAAYQPKPSTATKLTAEKAKSIFEVSFASMLSSLNYEYSSFCVVRANIEAYKKPMLEELATKSFASETEAKAFIDQRINLAKSNITEKIDDCRDRNTAQGIVDNEIESQQFRNSKLEEEEIRNIVSRHKETLKNSFGETIDAKELDRQIDTVKETIKQNIAKTIQQNSEYYISFFDTDGTIADSKKSKIRKRDSVVKFVVDPDDPTKATYTLLYDDAVMMRSGIQSYQGLLLPICKIDGHVDPNGNSIVQIGNDGTLFLSNGYWKVDEKLTVKII